MSKPLRPGWCPGCAVFADGDLCDCGDALWSAREQEGVFLVSQDGTLWVEPFVTDPAWEEGE